ncbi:MAG: hypothetical protein E6P95_00360 [Candidatus Moraniibacteriota bacterium]|nr:MAG: hypothetical protein E6P95_00360 [Candidatus Moranbacteria bacterium]
MTIMRSISEKYRVSLLLSWIFTLLLQASCAAPSHNTVPSVLNNAEFYKIYDEVLKKHALDNSARTVSIVRYTRPNLLDQVYACLARVDATPQWQSALIDLQRRNTSRYLLEHKFDLPLRYELAEEMERVGGQLAAPPGKDVETWRHEQDAKFEQYITEHFTQVEVSVPGVSEDGHLAIVYLAVSWAGGFQVLRKEADTWLIDEKPKCFWIS